MSKIICDVCGTSYPETAAQCPICGCVRPGETVSGSGNFDEATGNRTENYTYVKGGRFSKGNVKKRNQGKEIERKEVERRTPSSALNARSSSNERSGDKKEKNNNAGLLVVIVLLLLAIFAVCIYIVMQFLLPLADKPPVTTKPVSTNPGIQQTQDAELTQSTTAETNTEIPCESLVASKTEVTFDRKDASLLLNVSVFPENTTDEITYMSSDPSVVTVNDEGKITSVGSGEATIVITCGDISEECRVVCTFAEETTPSSEAVTEPAVADEEFKLNREDFTLFKKGEIWKLYNGSVPADQITWTTDNEKVVTVKNGVVTARGKGTTKVHAEYNGKKYSCIVHCAESVGDYQADDVLSNQEESGFTINKTDVTIDVAEEFSLILKDREGAVVTVSWVADDSTVCTIDGNIIKGATPGTTVVSAVYEGFTFECTVRVKNPTQ